MPNSHDEFRDIINRRVLLRVRKPSRYLGCEINSVHKADDPGLLSVCLAFPDLYDLGLGNLGILILYHILNARADAVCERAYAPAVDLEEILRAEGLPLFSVESKRPLRDFDILGFTLQHELSYTNILNMLDLGGIPVLAVERGDTEPVVIAGGPCAVNPEPLADFIDAFAIGDGEDVVLDIADAVLAARNRPRAERLEALAGIPGVYVPSLYPMRTLPDGWIVPDLERARPVTKRIVRNLDEAPFPVDYIVPFTEQAQDRISLEVLRGCTQSCRFCQAGMTTRPVRERSLGVLREQMERTLTATGYEQVALSSLSTCDYSRPRALVSQSVETATRHGASVSLPSLRTDSFSVGLSEMTRTIRQSGLTFAPEAATDRMRAVINKWISEDDLLAVTGEAFQRGWDVIKLYFMIGLPTETDGDVAAVGKLANRVLGHGRAVNRRARINLGVSTFIPKPHTPFQWDRQITIDETFAKHDLLRRVLGRNGPKFGRHDAEMSALEGLFSRADRRVGRLLHIAWSKGARFDAWTEHFNWPLWQESIAEWGLNPEDYTGPIPLERPLPWDHIDVLVDREYLREEHETSREGGLTRDCRYTRCNECGVIHAETAGCAAMLKASRDGIRIEREWNPPEAPVETALEPEERTRLVVTFAKEGLLRFLGHLELANAFQRVLRRAGIPVAMSQGFHPQPKLSFATPLPTGMESRNELADVLVVGSISCEDFVRRFNASAPEGLRVIQAEERPLTGPSLMARTLAGEYEIAGPVIENLEGKVRGILERNVIEVTRKSKNGPKVVNIRPFIEELSVDARDGGSVVTARLSDRPGKKGNPGEIAALLWPIESLSACRIVKTRTILDMSGPTQSAEFEPEPAPCESEP